MPLGGGETREGDSFERVGFETYSRVINNQGEQGYFRRTSRNSGLSGRLRGWIGSFADQIYPILAVAHFHQAYNNHAAASQALRCAHGLCEAQGSLDNGGGITIPRAAGFSRGTRCFPFTSMVWAQ